MKKKIENNLIVKANSIIEASYKLSLEEQRIIAVLTSMITSKDKDFKAYKLSFSEFANLLDVEDPNYSYMIKVSRQLISKAMIIKETDNTKLVISWLSSAKYYEGDGYVELCFDPKLKPYLLQLKDRFTKYYLKHVIHLTHSYSIRFYELLKQYEKIGWRIFELNELKKILGISEDDYPLYANFKDKVLKPVQKELTDKFDKNEIDLTFKFEEIKTSRKVTGIKFILVLREKAESKPEPKQVNKVINSEHQAEPKQVNTELLNFLLSFGVSRSKADALMVAYPESYIKEVLTYVQNKIDSGKVKDIPAFTISALEKDYRSEIKIPQQQQMTIEQKIQANIAAREAEIAKEQAILKEEQRIKDAIQAMLEADRLKLEKQAEKNINKKLGKLPCDADIFQKKSRKAYITSEMMKIYAKL